MHSHMDLHHKILQQLMPLGSCTSYPPKVRTSLDICMLQPCHHEATNVGSLQGEKAMDDRTINNLTGCGEDPARTSLLVVGRPAGVLQVLARPLPRSPGSRPDPPPL